jgi:hypothetical protein
MIRRAESLLFAALAGAGSVLLAACILDLDHLTGGSGGGGGATSSSTSASTGGSGGSGTSAWSSSSGSGGGDAGCPLLDCTCDPGPTVIASGAGIADIPRGIVVAGGDLIWANHGSDNLVRIAQGASAPAEVTKTTQPRGLAVAGSSLVWTADDGVYACTLPSCSDGHEVASATAPGSLRSVAFDGQTAVWSDRGSGANTGKTLSCAITGCSPITLADNMVAPEGVAVYGTNAFWVDLGTGNQNGVVARSPKTSSQVAQIAAALNLPNAVAADDTYTYWTESVPNGHVYRCALAAGYCDNPEDVAPAAGGLGRPRDVRVGNGRVYWTNADDGTVMSCPLPGCGSAMPKVHVTGRQQIGWLAIGASCVFWAEDGGGVGAIGKVAR